MAREREIEERLAVVCSQLNALHAELVELVADAVSCDAWSGVGIRSIEHWLTWKAGVSSATAHQLTRLAHARSTHPSTSAVFEAGSLTLDQAATAVTIPACWDDDIAELAPLSTVVQIRTEVRVAGPDPTTPETPPAASADTPVESVTVRHDDDGRWSMRADLDADHGKIVDAALQAARDRLFHGGQTTVTWVDALIEMAEASLDAQPVERRDRFRPNLFLDPTADVAARWADRSAIPDWLARLLTCDGRVSPVFVDAATPISVGRTQRTVPERTRRHILHRDRQQCRMPWCTNTRWLDIHHIIEWQHGGPTDTPNLAPACPCCHRALHRGDFTITGNADDPDGLVFTDRHGRTIEPGTRPPPGIGPPPMPPTRYEHPLGERLDTRWLHFPDPPAA